MTGRISVSLNSQNRCDRAELVKDFVAADIARVENELDPSQCAEHRWTHEAVRVRDQPDDAYYPQRRESACSTPR